MPPKPSQTGSQIGVANRTAIEESHVRTNERTERVETCVNQETAVDASARIEDFTTIGAVIQAGQLWQSDTRHEVVRTGEREPIPSHVRSAVFYRDHGRCDYCNPEFPSNTPLELDHIIPWSAGGTDTTENLRLLCQEHNQRRSNYVDHARPKMPATWWCSRCYLLDVHVWEYLASGHVVCPIHSRDWGEPGKSRCRVTRRYYAKAQEGDPQTWHQRPLLTECDLIAYCAHCGLPGVTGVVL